MNLPFFQLNGVNIPRFFYGTAWKEDRTAELVAQAIRAGFRAIDTANQRKHYFEQGVGHAIGQAISSGLVTRPDLFVQSKFTFRRGQDDRLPYDPAAPIGEQVQQSFASSLEHLGIEQLDSLVLHGPSMAMGLGQDDWSAWRAMEDIQQRGGCRFLGISNVQLDQLQTLVENATVPPTFVQNRCYASRGWDRAIRKFCSDNGIVYQGFSLLTANREVLASKTITQLAVRYKCNAAQVVFRFALEAGMIPLTGTTSTKHMQEDLTVFDIRVDPDEVVQIERIAG